MHILRLNFTIGKSQLVAIVGSTGSGKSSILSAILGEMHAFQGRINVFGKIAYVSQASWIKNSTIKENILFGKKFDEKFYENCIDTCALKDDLKLFEMKDETEIGEKVSKV